MNLGCLRPRAAAWKLLLLIVLQGMGCSGRPDARDDTTSRPEKGDPHAMGRTAPADKGKQTPRQEMMSHQPAASATAEVSIDNFTYSPQTLTVAVGTKVTWTNRDDVPHTVTSSSKPRTLDSGTLDTDQTFSHVFSTPGTFEYFCAVHPRMTGKVFVK
jgi:plastocyanin